jgi:hypothetical protein
LLSPSALIGAAAGKPVTLLRTDKKTGQLQRLSGTLISDAGGGVVFETAEGIEALRCSGLPETFSFSGVTDLKATPTLSVLVKLASIDPHRDFVLSGARLRLGGRLHRDGVGRRQGNGPGAWVTLANGSGVDFPQRALKWSREESIAGRRGRGDVEPLDAGSAIFAQCWPRGSTSDAPESLLVAGRLPGSWIACSRSPRQGRRRRYQRWR